jgi:hypothetical protein
VEFSCPEYANESIEFNCNIRVETNTSYDVKVDILNNTTRLSEIYDNGWKSSNYYLNNFTLNNETKQVRLIISNFSGNASGNLKLRKNGKTAIDYTSNFSIYVVKSSSSQDNLNNSQDNISIDNLNNNEEKKNSSIIIESVDKIEYYLFKIKISAYYLENKYYDFKVYIEDKDKLISEIYDDNSSNWISGNYYLNRFYATENISKIFDIRI